MYNQIEKNEIENVNRYKDRLSNINKDFDIGLFIYITKKNSLWILLTIILMVLAAFLYLRYTAPIFSSQSIIQIKKSNQANRLLDVEDYYETNDISAELEILQSNIIVERAIKSLPLEVSYYTQGQFLTNEIYSNNPFDVNILWKDSTMGSRKVMIDFVSKEKGTLSWHEGEKIVRQNVHFNQKVELPFAHLVISINNYEHIKNEPTAVKPISYFFIINDLQTLVKDVLSRLKIFVVNINAKTVSIAYDDINRIKTKDIVSSVIREAIFLFVHK